MLLCYLLPSPCGKGAAGRMPRQMRRKQYKPPDYEPGGIFCFQDYSLRGCTAMASAIIAS